jgi:uncharacterized membrane protein (GlpM family)
MELIWRFLVGGFIVSLFAVIGDVLRPRGFAGLFGAAPSVALATLALTVVAEGRAYAALEARSMIVGAAAFCLYTVACVYFVGVRRLKAPVMTFGLLALWGLSAFGLWSVFLR